MNVLRQYIIQLRVALLVLCISMAADSLCQQQTAAGDTPVASQTAATPDAVSQAAAATEAASATISSANWIGQPSLEKARYYEVSTVKPKTLF